MILTCPECATGYFVDDAQMRPGGRVVAVRCLRRALDGACPRARWSSSIRPKRAPWPGDPGVLAEEPPLTGDDLPKVFRSRAEDEKRMRRAAVSGAIWAGVAVVVAAVIGALAIFRQDIVRVWPRSASAYAAVGLSVNPIGLRVEQLKAVPSLQAGHAILAVSGVIRSISNRAVPAPPLRISLFNAQGKRVAGQIVVLQGAPIPPGQVRHFATAIFDPPFSAQNGTLQVEFAPGATGPATKLSGTKAPQAAAPPIALRGPAVVDQGASNTIDAQPLAPGQPAALPPGGDPNAHD